MRVAKVGLGKKSKDHVDIMKEILADGKEYLEEIKAIYERKCENFAHDMPSLDSTNVTNCSTYALTSDACNQAQKSRKIVWK